MKKHRRLWHIIRTTKVIEEVVGLFVLMVIVSLVLSRIEPGITNFEDALWFSFSVVTTIGFGDIVVVTLVGRLLTMLLGLYGIFLVAIITSVVVNYYQSTHVHPKE